MSLQPSQSNKRKRTENDSRDVNRDLDVWLPDGNIVVVAQGVAFRVHKSILSQHSEIFRDLFSLPDGGTNELMDGCPVVQQEGDDPYDLHRLFAVLCCGKKCVPYLFAD